jgi:uncharacterized protein (DUF3084 family)
MANIGSESTLEMNSLDKVQYAKSWFQNAEQIRTNMEEGYGSQLEDLDEQLSVRKDEIGQGDKKLKSVDDWAERERLTSERSGVRTFATALPS